MECIILRMNPKVSYTLWMIMMHQYVFIYGNKYTAFMEDVVNGGSCACVGVGGIWESLYLPLNFAVNLKLL